jgi:hypothetical protein
MVITRQVNNLSVVDVLIWTFSLGNRFHVLNLMAWLLAKLIETLVWALSALAFNSLEINQLLFLSLQARLVGLVHFPVGYIYIRRSLCQLQVSLDEYFLFIFYNFCL